MNREIPYLPDSPIENLAPIWRDHQGPFKAIHVGQRGEGIPGQDGRVTEEKQSLSKHAVLKKTEDKKAS